MNTVGKLKVIDTSNNIINVARNLFSEYSYLGVSMNDIAKKLNITKAALYYHFTSKAEIYNKVLDEVYLGLQSEILEALEEKTLEKRLKKVIRNYLDFGSVEKNLIKALMIKFLPDNKQVRQHIIRLREKSVALICPLIEEILEKEKYKEDIEGKLLTSLLTGMMDGLLLESSFLKVKIDSNKVSDQIIAVLF